MYVNQFYVQYVWPRNITDYKHLEIYISHLANKDKWKDECLTYGTIYQCWEMGTSFTELTTHTHTAYAHTDLIYQGPNYRLTRLKSIALTAPAGAAGYSASEHLIVFAARKSSAEGKRRQEHTCNNMIDVQRQIYFLGMHSINKLEVCWMFKNH